MRPSDSTAANELPARSTTPASTTFVQNYFILVSSITFYSLSPLINHTNVLVYLVTPWPPHFEIGPTAPSCERSFNPSLGWGILGGFYIMIQNWCVGQYIYFFRLLIPLPMVPTATHPSSMNGTLVAAARLALRHRRSPCSPPHLTPHLTSLPISLHSHSGPAGYCYPSRTLMDHPIVSRHKFFITHFSSLFPLTLSLLFLLLQSSHSCAFNSYRH